MIKILFVCHGNICRSPMGEYILKDMVDKRGIADEFIISSCGVSDEELGNPVYPPAQRKLREMNIPAPPRRARQLCAADYGDWDQLLCMEDCNVRWARDICGGDPEGKIMRLLDLTVRPHNISDPWYSGDFDRAYDEIREGCEALLNRLGY